jgi:hypothetical protein
MLFRVSLFCAMLTVPLGSALAQPALDSPDINRPVELTEPVPFALLDQWNVKCYEYLENRQERVRASGATVNVFRPHRVAVVLTSTWLHEGEVNMLDDWPVRDGTHRLQERIYATYGTGSFLAVNRIHVRTLQHHIMGVREGEVLNYTIDGAPGSEPMNAESLTLATLMRVVTVLPMVQGSFEARDWLDIPELELSDTKLPIVCHGAETIYLRGSEHETTKYTYGGYAAWVRNSDRVLLRLEMPGRRYLELLKDGNCCSAERLRKFVDQVRVELDDDDAVVDPAAPLVPANPANPAVPANPTPADPANPLPF